MQDGGRIENSSVCDLLFKQIEKPKNLEMCKAINVYSDRYRINVYTKHYDELHDLHKIKISQSFFCKLSDSNELTIIA